MGEKPLFQSGLEGVIASETNISYLDVENEQIVIRGYDLIELANRVGYVDLIGLLLDGKLPNEAEREMLQSDLSNQCELPAAVLQSLKYDAPNKDAMDMLRTGISILASYDEELADRSKQANRRKAIRLLAKIPSLVANSYRIQMAMPLIAPRKDLSYCANFLYMLTGNIPNEQEERAFEQSLIVYSEHEMPNSTFVSRVIASTQSDLYGALVGAVASLKGTLHGGANEAVMHMLLEAETADQLERIMMKKLAAKDRIMGFGHRVYMKKTDPRALLMKQALARLSALKGDHQLYEMCERGELMMYREKGLYPNLDYYAAPVYYMLGIPIDLYTPIFLAARTSGIGAHVIEQHENNRLFRPRVHYLGPRGLHPNHTKEGV